MAFASRQGGNLDIWVVDCDGKNLQRVTSDPGDETRPAWSPDGNQLAYNRENVPAQRWEIWCIDLRKPGRPRFLAYGVAPEWDALGERITFLRPDPLRSPLTLWTVPVPGDPSLQDPPIARLPVECRTGPRWNAAGQWAVQPTAAAVRAGP